MSYTHCLPPSADSQPGRTWSRSQRTAEGMGTRRVWFKMPEEDTESPLLPALNVVKL